MTVFFAILLARALDLTAVLAVGAGFVCKRLWAVPVIAAAATLIAELVLSAMQASYVFRPGSTAIGFIAMCLWALVGTAWGKARHDPNGPDEL